MVINLSDGGDPRFQRLYEWLETNAVNAAWHILGNDYQYIEVLIGSEVSSSEFVESIITNAMRPSIVALDVITVLHGLQGKLFFHDGPVSTAKINQMIAGAKLENRLRLLYSTACYGATHAQDFVDAGFRTASGARGICANGPFDFPVQLYNWSKGKTYKSTVKAANHELGLLTHDTLISVLGFTNVDSFKIIKGKKLTRISSEAF